MALRSVVHRNEYGVAKRGGARIASFGRGPGYGPRISRIASLLLPIFSVNICTFGRMRKLSLCFVVQPQGMLRTAPSTPPLHERTVSKEIHAVSKLSSYLLPSPITLPRRKASRAATLQYKLLCLPPVGKRRLFVGLKSTL